MASDSLRGDWLALCLVASLAAGSAWAKRGGSGNKAEVQTALEAHLRKLLDSRTNVLISGVRWKLAYGDPSDQIPDWPGVDEACRQIDDDMRLSFPRRLYYDTVFEDIVEKPEGQRPEDFIEFNQTDMKKVVLGRDVYDNTPSHSW